MDEQQPSGFRSPKTGFPSSIPTNFKRLCMKKLFLFFTLSSSLCLSATEIQFRGANLTDEHGTPQFLAGTEYSYVAGGKSNFTASSGAANTRNVTAISTRPAPVRRTLNPSDSTHCTSPVSRW
ncbi:MAG: hypothetical protein L6W00_26355 [Lentisphaeria bacterium]|nr:MAG: hypothetical protein L6W00_26355 [Lentisphaeria bacterium]